MFIGVYDKYRRGGRFDNPFRHAAEQQVLDAGETAGAHHDEVGAVNLGCVDDALVGVAVLGMDRGAFDATGFRFTPATGFPLVDFAASEWSDSLRQLRAFHRPSPPFAWGLDLGLSASYSTGAPVTAMGYTPQYDNWEYYLSRPLFLYSDGGVMQEKPQVADYINYFLTHTNDVIEEVGYFPANPEALGLAKLRWLNAMEMVK